LEQAGGHYMFAREEIYPRRLLPWQYNGEQLSLAVPAGGCRIHLGEIKDHACQAAGKHHDIWKSIDFPPYTEIKPVVYYYFNFLFKTA